jgi:hypothetical protein
MKKKWLLSAGGVSLRFNARGLPDFTTRDWQFFLAVFACPVALVAILLGGWMGTEFCDCHQQFVRNQRIDREHFERIRLGMRQEDVEEILGGPPGDYRTVVEHDLTVGGFWCFRDPDERLEWWEGDKGFIRVTFDEEQTACSLDFCPSDTPGEPSLLREFLRRVKREARAFAP